MLVSYGEVTAEIANITTNLDGFLVRLSRIQR